MKIPRYLGNRDCSFGGGPGDRGLIMLVNTWAKVGKKGSFTWTLPSRELLRSHEAACEWGLKHLKAADNWWATTSVQQWVLTVDVDGLLIPIQSSASSDVFFGYTAPYVFVLGIYKSHFTSLTVQNNPYLSYAASVQPIRHSLSKISSLPPPFKPSLLWPMINSGSFALITSMTSKLWLVFLEMFPTKTQWK